MFRYSPVTPANNAFHKSFVSLRALSANSPYDLNNDAGHQTAKIHCAGMSTSKDNAYNNSEPRELGATACTTKPAIKNIVAAAEPRVSKRKLLWRWLRPSRVEVQYRTASADTVRNEF